jgi:hypothetical protein
MLTLEQMRERVAEIDAMFETAMRWGSWMIMCANERESLVNNLQAQGVNIEHKYQARLANGDRTD